MMPTSDDVREPIQGRAVAGHAQGRLELFYTCMVDNRAIVMYGPFPVGKDGKFGGMADGHVFGLCIPVVDLGGHDGLSLALRAQIIPTAYVPMTLRLHGGLLAGQERKSTRLNSRN